MDELRAGNPLLADKVTLVPIERWVIQSGAGDMGCWLSGLKEPFAIIVCDETGIRAFDTQATEVAVASLIQQVPDLDALLNRNKHPKQ
ncbi:MAG: hypothetical protein OEQ39_17540 [Gammaproteobacteria bacterium]|nr:hypothetical protein [Gammaproteobacteria bacterium]MDH3468240.1 hypothetical protein [Gammaproteobacteria bacterium]